MEVFVSAFDGDVGGDAIACSAGVVNTYRRQGPVRYGKVAKNVKITKGRGEKSFPASANGLVRSPTRCEPKEPWG